MKLRPKRVEFEAFRLPERGDFDVDAFHKWAEEVGFENGRHWESGRDESMIVFTSVGEVSAEPGDWIIKSAAFGVDLFDVLTNEQVDQAFEVIP